MTQTEESIAEAANGYRQKYQKKLTCACCDSPPIYRDDYDDEALCEDCFDEKALLFAHENND